MSKRVSSRRRRAVKSLLTALLGIITATEAAARRRQEPHPSDREFARATGSRLDDHVRQSRLAVLPLGSIEYHGPSGPPLTDSVIAVGLAERGAAHVNAVEAASKDELLFRLGNKEQEFAHAITKALGLTREVLADPIVSGEESPFFAPRETFAVAIPGQRFTLTATVVNRSRVRIEPVEIRLRTPPGWRVNKRREEMSPLGYNGQARAQFELSVPENAEYTRLSHTRRSGSRSRVGGPAVSDRHTVEREVMPDRDRLSFMTSVAQEILRRSETDISLTLSARLEDASEGQGEDPFDAATGYHRMAIDVMTALVSSHPKRVVVDVVNRGAIADLEATDVVEVPCLIDKSGPRPLAVGRLPHAVRGLVQSVKAYERLAIRASVERSDRLARLALTVHPLVGQWELATQIIDRMIQSDSRHLGYLR